jgi:hypothetical protein
MATYEGGNAEGPPGRQPARARVAATALTEHPAYPGDLIRRALRDNVTGAALTLSEGEPTQLNSIASWHSAVRPDSVRHDQLSLRQDMIGVQEAVAAFSRA